MSIHRVQTGSVATNAAGQTQKKTAMTPTSTLADVASVKDTKPKAVAIGVKGDGVNARLAAYQDKVTARLDYALKNDELSDRQRAALEKAKAKFQSSIQRLDEAYSGNVDGKKPVKDGLQNVLDMLRQSVNHIRAGENVDIKA